MTKPKYTVVYDDGKPWDESYNSDEELKAGLKKDYIALKARRDEGDDFPHDVFIYNANDEDISEEQFIAEMIAEIMKEVGEC